MILKKLAERIAKHPWYFHLFNGFSTILSMVIVHAVGQLKTFLLSLGVESPTITQWVFNNYFGMSVVTVAAMGLSGYGYFANQQGKNIDGVKQTSIGLLLFSLLCAVVCLVGMYLSLPLK